MEKPNALRERIVSTINDSKDRCGMTTTEFARRIGTSDSNAGKKLRGEVSISAEELVMVTFMFGIDFNEYLAVPAEELPEQIHPFGKRKL